MCYGRSCAGCYHSGSCDTQDSIEYDEDNPYKSDSNDREGYWGSYDSDEDDDDGWGGGSSW